MILGQHWMTMTPFIILGAIMTPISDGVAQALEGSWRGAITLSAANVELDISVTFSSTADSLSATIDIPAQGATGLKLHNIYYAPPQIRFEIAGVPGQPRFDGTLAGEKITGLFTQGGVSGTFALERSTAEPAADTLPYHQQQIVFENNDVQLSGTLTIPYEGLQYPAVVLISGSGPQNRNGDVFGFEMFRTMADHLTRRGIAVLRYDDRGVGQSTGNLADATTEDFAGDVRAAVALLATRSDIKQNAIGLIGHSEGGLVAPLAAQSSDVAFLVLLAGPAMSGAEILVAQGELIVRASGGDDAAVHAQRQLQEAIFGAVRTDRGWEDVRSRIATQLRQAIDALPVEQRSAISDADAVVQTRVDAELRRVQSPWFRHFIDYDPIDVLRRTRVPVLALFGELDLQVPPQVNRARMEQALRGAGNVDFRTGILSAANHLFMPATTGHPGEYASGPKEFVPELLEQITGWILERAR